MNRIPSESEFGLRAIQSHRQVPISATVVTGIVFLIDTLALVGSGSALYLQQINLNADTLSLYTAAICFVWVAVVLLFQFSELYRFEAVIRPLAHLDKLIIAFGTAFLFLLAAAFAFKVSATFSRFWIGVYGMSAFALTIGGRLMFSEVVSRLTRRGVFSRNLIVVGKSTHVEKLLERLQAVGPEFMHVTALFVDGRVAPVIGACPVAGDLGDVEAYIRSHRVDDVVLAMPWSSEAEILALTQRFRELPVNVYLGTDLIGLRLDFREPPEHFRGMPIVAVAGHPMSGWAVAIKAVEDYLLAVLFLIVLALPMALIALIVSWDSPGPVLFRQKRLGFNNKVFWIYKFRTMQHQDTTEAVTVQAKRDDPRVTRIGKFLRRSSLDELPQLFNVLQGTMSLVGPRPHAVDHNAAFAQKIRGYFARHRVKPGITGWAQVNGFRGETEVPEKMEARVRHDVHYTENWSLFFDLRILMQTVMILITRRNAY